MNNDADQLFGAITPRDQLDVGFARFLRDHVAAGAVGVAPACKVKNQGDFFVSPVTDASHFVVRGKDGNLRRFLNVCPHYQGLKHAPTSDWSDGYWGTYQYDRGRCGCHAWATTTEGVHVTPKILVVPSGSQCTHLKPGQKLGECLEEIGGMIWVGPPEKFRPLRRLVELPLAKECGLTSYVKSGYTLKRIWIDNGRFSAFMGMVIFEDMNHPGKGIHRRKLDAVAVMREQRRNYDPELGVSIQVVPWNWDVDPNTLSVFWKKYYELCLHAKKMGITDPSGGMIGWLADYNNFFTNEHYPFMSVNSWFLPTEDGGVRNVVEFYFPEEVLDKIPELADAAMAAYMGGTYTSEGQVIYDEGIAQEDAELAMRCMRGMKILCEYGYGNQLMGPLDNVTDRAVHSLHHYIAPRWEAWKAQEARRGQRHQSFKQKLALKGG